MSKAVQQGSRQAFRAKDLGPLIKGQIGGDQGRAPLVALAEDLEQQLQRLSDARVKPNPAGGREFFGQRLLDQGMAEVIPSRLRRELLGGPGF